VLFDLGVASGPVDPIGGSVGTVVVGTPAYLAPELIGCDPAPASIEQDVYSLGCIAYQLICGAPPYDGDTASELFRAQLEQPVPPIPDEVGAGAHLVGIINSMLSREPSDRPSSVAAISRWLRGIQRGRSEASRPGREIAVLVVDDDPDQRALLAALIEQTVDEVEVTTAVDGLDALEQVARRPPAIMFVDLEMPRLSGLELCMHLAAMPEAADTTLCVISGRVTPMDRTLLQQLGVRSIVEKGEPPQQIIEAIERLVDPISRRPPG
jgi:serine/threonine-protein kinase